MLLGRLMKLFAIEVLPDSNRHKGVEQDPEGLGFSGGFRRERLDQADVGSRLAGTREDLDLHACLCSDFWPVVLPGPTGGRPAATAKVVRLSRRTEFLLTGPAGEKVPDVSTL